MISIEEINKFIFEIYSSVRPTLAILWTGICWVIFPDPTYIYAAIAVTGAIILDLFTKLYALSVVNGGYLSAVKKKIITSEILWRKAQVKIVSFLVIMIMMGLTFRLTPPGLLTNGLAMLIYSIIFLKEFQSILENLIDAGNSDVKWLLRWLRRKAYKIDEENICNCESEEIEEKIDEQK